MLDLAIANNKTIENRFAITPEIKQAIVETIVEVPTLNGHVVSLHAIDYLDEDFFASVEIQFKIHDLIAQNSTPQGLLESLKLYFRECTTNEVYASDYRYLIAGHISDSLGAMSYKVLETGYIANKFSANYKLRMVNVARENIEITIIRDPGKVLPREITYKYSAETFGDNQPAEANQKELGLQITKVLDIMSIDPAINLNFSNVAIRRIN